METTDYASTATFKDVKLKPLLIIGNGFDLNLGRKTKFKDFADKEIGFFPKNQGEKLASYLEKENEAWGDLELSLEKYASLSSEEHSYEQDSQYFQALKESFRRYLHKVLHGSPNKENMNKKVSPIFKDFTEIDKESCAYYFCEHILRDKVIRDIITFNYTDILSTFQQVAHECNDPEILYNPYDYNRIFVHRFDDTDELVLGISNDADLKDPRYTFLKKSHQAVLPNIYDYLMGAKTVIFWGISFSTTDHCYFKDYFKAISNRSELGQGKQIYIVTYNHESFIRCISEIERMIGGDLTSLFIKNTITGVYTNQGVNSYNFSNLLNLSD